MTDVWYRPHRTVAKSIKIYVALRAYVQATQLSQKKIAAFTPYPLPNATRFLFILCS